jgi:hypothetical protein
VERDDEAEKLNPQTEWDSETIERAAEANCFQ